jgi:hypothetical protein
MIVPLGIAFAIAVLGIIIMLLLRRKLREKYATLWLIIGLVILILAVFPQLLVWLAHALGVIVPSNLLFALAIVLLVGVALHLSWELSTAEEEVRRLAEEAALIRTEAEKLSARIDALERGTASPGPASRSSSDPENG